LKFNKHDPSSPWQTVGSDLRLNSLETEKTTLESNGESYDVYMTTSPKAASSNLVDVEIKKSGSDESIKTFEGVDSYLDDEGLLVSSLDNKQSKSNVVLHNDDVVVFDGVSEIKGKEKEKAYVLTFPPFFYSMVVPT
jgi:3-methylcrotonyl-CoA carboxylase alpha subunit